MCSSDSSLVFQVAGETYDWTSCPHCGEPSDDIVPVCAHRLLFCRDILFGVHNDWANLVDMASVQGLNLLAVQPNGMEARLMGTHFKT
jgi:hypothetical protein